MVKVEESTAAAAAADRWAKSIGGGSTADDAAGDDWRPGKSTCWAIWREELAVFEVLQPRGDSLRCTGSVWQGRTMLHAEEGLWLAERGMLAVHPAPPKAQHPAATADAATANPEPTSSRTACGPPWAEQRESEDIRIPQRRRDTERHEGVNMAPANRSTIESVAVPSVEPTVAAPSTTIGPAPAALPAPVVSRGGGGAGDAGMKGFCPAVPPSEQPPMMLQGSPSPPLVPTSAPPLALEACPIAAENQDAASTTAGAAPNQERRVAIEGDRRKREGGGRGVKRARTRADQGPRPFLLIGALYEKLSRAGVPWECYQAYAELKRRSYVVRRRPEDTIGHDQNSPRAARMLWFRGPRVAPQHSTSDPVGRVGDSVPVSFHLYAPNTPFKKRDPGPPDSLLAVCRYGDQMPTHEALVSLAENHAKIRRRSEEGGRATFSGGARDRRGGSGGGNGEGSGLGDGAGDVTVKKLPPRGGEEKEGGADCQRFDVDGGLEGAGGGRREREAGAVVSSRAGRVPGVKLSVVSGEGNVHLFDVGLHDDMP